MTDEVLDTSARKRYIDGEGPLCRRGLSLVAALDIGEWATGLLKTTVAVGRPGMETPLGLFYFT